jgi:hypothetical protein
MPRAQFVQEAYVAPMPADIFQPKTLLGDFQTFSLLAEPFGCRSGSASHLVNRLVRSFPDPIDGGLGPAYCFVGCADNFIPGAVRA